MNALVYSTAVGRICPDCGKPINQCGCKGRSKKPKAMGAAAQNLSQNKDGIIRVGRESKGRGGKGVSLITGLPLNGEDLKDLSKKLKQKCGTGGTVKNGIIEIQGNHRDTLVKELENLGYKVKKAGG